MNFIHIAGNLGTDPETRFTQSGKKVTTLRVATHSRKGGQDVTIWWRVTIWDEQFKNMIPHLKKGSSVMVFGEMQKPEIYTDREGKSQVSLEMTASQLQFSPFGKPGGSQNTNDGQQQTQGSYTQAPNPYMGGMPAMGGGAQPQGSTFDDEVPF
ncbi:MAG TPA: single-stranded DNA-binding protein [Chlamydiales bacterium]|nr:single-stranded DNA-binding protein [Chlamydiales bacterium]